MDRLAGALRPVDRLEVWSLVDTALDLLSTTPRGVTGELANLVRAGMEELSGSGVCCAAWGLSLLIRVSAGGAQHAALFDAGPEASVFERNATLLGADLAGVEAAILSHGHFDHAGGLPAALRLIRKAGGRTVTTHVNPGMFAPRAYRFPDGRLLPLQDVPAPERLAEAGGAVINSEGWRTLLEGTLFLSGEIPRLTRYEQGLPHQVRRAADGAWVPDPLVQDERFLAVHVRGRGLVVLSACSHAGIVNVLREAARLFDPLPVHAVIGGLHLSGAAAEPWIDDTVRDLEEFGIRRLVPCHCTGWRATHALVRAFGDRVLPGAVGRIYRFGGDDDA